MFFFLMFLATVFSAPVDIVVHKDNNPLVKGLIAQPNFVKNLIQNQNLISELAEADPDTLRSILGLLEGLVSVSEAASLKFTTDVNDAAQVKATKSDTLVVAVQTEVDATAAVAAAQRALTAAEVAKATATTSENIAQGEYNEADSHHTAMVKERTDKQPGVDAETVTMNKALDLIKSLLPDSCELRECSTTEGCPLARNNSLTTIPTLKKEFFISLELKATSYIAGWQGVIHFTTDGNCCSVGDRIPALWVSDDGQLYPRFAVNGSGDYGIMTAKKYPLNQWTKVQFSQTLVSGKYIYVVLIDGKSEIEVENSQAQEFSNVEVWAADDWHTSLKGSIRNLVVNADGSEPCVV